MSFLLIQNGIYEKAKLNWLWCKRKGIFGILKICPNKRKLDNGVSIDSFIYGDKVSTVQIKFLKKEKENILWHEFNGKK